MVEGAANAPTRADREAPAMAVDASGRASNSAADLPTRLRQAYVAHAVAGLLPRRRNAFAKRALDLTLGLLLLVVALPLLGALALAIRLGWLGRAADSADSRRASPVLVRLRYAGLGGRAFVGASLPALRATRLRWLAGLPLLLNVIQGEMSLVGPRPMLVDEWMAQDDTSALPTAYALARLYAKPGLISPAMVRGVRSAERDHDASDELTPTRDPDLWYVAHGSFGGDALLLMRAPIALLRATMR